MTAVREASWTMSGSEDDNDGDFLTVNRDEYCNALTDEMLVDVDEDADFPHPDVFSKKSATAEDIYARDSPLSPPSIEACDSNAGGERLEEERRDGETFGFDVTTDTSLLPQISHVLVVVHSNFRPISPYQQSRHASRSVSPRDIVGLFVGNVNNFEGRLFRIAGSESTSSGKNNRRTNSRAVYVDKFYNRRNFVTFPSYVCPQNYDVTAGTVVPPEDCSYALSDQRDVRLEMCENFAAAAQRCCRYLRNRGIYFVSHKLSPPVQWVLYALNNLMPELSFDRMPRDVNAREVAISSLCYNRVNHNSVACEICLFDEYARQLREKYDRTSSSVSCAATQNTTACERDVDNDFLLTSL